MDINKIVNAANCVSDEYDAAVILYNGPIDYDGFGELLIALQPSKEQPQKENVILILTTLGGVANAGYQIARTLQEGFEKVTLYVPHVCKSAGTLIALGVNELVMDGIAHLGPLDVQLLEKDEIGRRRSGLILQNAFDGLSEATFEAFEKVLLGIKTGSGGVVSFEIASKIAAQIASQVMSPVYAQINPDALGNDLRDLNVATEYGRRLAAIGQNTLENTVHRLVHQYPSHDFIIDRKEAEGLFRRVGQPCANLSELEFALGGAVYDIHPSPTVVRLDKILEEEPDDTNTKKAKRTGREEPSLASERDGER